MLDAHVWQMYEWLPWLDGTLDQVPKDPAARTKWLAEQRSSRVLPDWKQALGDGMADKRLRSSMLKRLRSPSMDASPMKLRFASWSHSSLPRNGSRGARRSE